MEQKLKEEFQKEFAFQKQNEISIGDRIDVYLDKIENHNGECYYTKAKSKGVNWKVNKAGELLKVLLLVKSKVDCHVK